mmetsp:Transcript_67759/g.137925  ORF Transcript_67759/g.137925 Transcript_67759/m.137925 type:complete len:134 (+) Transcript_67759:1437-1838(+)
MPFDDNLRRSEPLLFCYLFDDCMIENLLFALGTTERGVRLHQDIVAGAKIQKRNLGKQRVTFHLVDHRRDGAASEQSEERSFVKVANPECLASAFLDKRFHATPDLFQFVQCYDIGGPVKKKQIDGLSVQLLK